MMNDKEYYGGGIIPNRDFAYSKELDIVLLISDKQKYEVKRHEFLKMMTYLYENIHINDDKIYMMDVYTDGKTRSYSEIIANNP